MNKDMARLEIADGVSPMAPARRASTTSTTDLVRADDQHRNSIESESHGNSKCATGKDSETSSKKKVSQVAETQGVHKPTNRRRVRKKSVTFASRAQALIIPNVQDYTDAQKQRMWQTPEDKKSDQADLVRTVRAARTANVEITTSNRRCSIEDDEDELCYRGLEHLCSPASMNLKVRRREKLNDALLDEQDAQWQSGAFHVDDEVLRAISIKITAYDTKRAIMLAAQDEAEVKAMRRMDATMGL